MAEVSSSLGSEGRPAKFDPGPEARCEFHRVRHFGVQWVEKALDRHVSGVISMRGLFLP